MILHNAALGIGFLWDQPEVTIDVNDRVMWSWTKPRTVKFASFSIRQTPDANEDPDGTGFSSGSNTANGKNNKI